MILFQSDQIIAAIIRRSEHDAIAADRQHVRRFSIDARRNRRAVRIDQTNGLKSNSQKIFGRGGESFTKSITALWHQLEIVRQDVDVRLFRADRSVNRNALHILTRRFQDCGGGVAKKTGVERRRFIRGEWRDETRFHMTGARRFCHDGERTAPSAFGANLFCELRSENAMSQLHSAGTLRLQRVQAFSQRAY